MIYLKKSIQREMKEWKVIYQSRSRILLLNVEHLNCNWNFITSISMNYETCKIFSSETGSYLFGKEQ